jgi:hypothetical protein
MKRSIIHVMGGLSLAAVAIPSSAPAAYITVYGTPTYTPGTGGFQAIAATGVNNSGTAVAYATGAGGASYSGIRWNSAGSAIELGNLNGPAGAFAINDAGTAVGYAYIYDDLTGAEGARAVRWDASGTPTKLGRLGTDADWDPDDSVRAINAAGTAVGYAAGPAGGSRAVRWDASGTVATALGSLGPRADGYTNDQALAINAAGMAVGYALNFDVVGKGQFAARWDASGAATELGSLGTNSSGLAYAMAGAINAAGTAVGSAEKYDNSGTPRGSRAVRWDAAGTAATELGILGTDATGLTDGVAIAINDAGTAIGEMWKYDAAGVNKGQRAVRWDPSGTAATELGNLDTRADGYTNSIALAINAGGIVIGYDETDTTSAVHTSKAVYWEPDGAPIDLNILIDPTSGWTLTQAQVINDTNWIAGIGNFDPDGPGGQPAYQRGFLIHLPDPGGLALLSLSGVALLRRRRPA